MLTAIETDDPCAMSSRDFHGPVGRIHVADNYFVEILDRIKHLVEMGRGIIRIDNY